MRGVPADAISERLARTAGLIASAAITIVVFATVTFGNFLVVKMIGFMLAVSVFIEATLMRIVMGPALLRIAGDLNWRSGGLTRHADRRVSESRMIHFIAGGHRISTVAVSIREKNATVYGVTLQIQDLALTKQ